MVKNEGLAHCIIKEQIKCTCNNT